MNPSLLRPRGALLAALALLLLTARAALAAGPLVDVDWLKAHLNKADVAIIDLQPATDYLRGHIPGAVNSDYAKDGWREKRADGVPGVFPAKIDKLVAHIGSLGIDNNTQVVVVPVGINETDLGAATRIYWTFKVLGHDRVAVLDGGMSAWTAEKDKSKANPLQTGAVKVAAKSFKASLRPEMIVSMAEVEKAQKDGTLLIDFRPSDQFMGITRHPATVEAGTLAGARNLPVVWLTENGSGRFRNKAQLEQLYKLAGVPTRGAEIDVCNTGHWASLGWFVSSELLGNPQARLYDGSMAEWTRLNKTRGMERQVKLD